ncbi:estradiol 17-beta-dehydrogenase [Whalleya microplaca]|nr:estradiol 17-beta-dehydrogenase [Whalleya microplaca]
MTGNVWFIAGASNGFGRAIGFEALKRGDKVVATSRNTAKMTDLKEAGAMVLPLDITSDDATISAALQQAVDAYGKITHCINTAGYILEGAVEAASSQEVQQTFATNVFGPINMTRNVLRYMRPQRHGVIANFGSLGSWRGAAAGGYYASTKWAVSGFTESLHDEVRPLGISAVIVEPGYFRTGFLRAGGGNRLFTARQMLDEYRDTAVPAVKDRLNAVNDNQPGDVAKGARVVVDVLTSTGVAAGREIPMRLVLGRDAMQVIRGKMESTEKLLEEWEDIIVSTDHDDVQKQ